MDFCKYSSLCTHETGWCLSDLIQQTCIEFHSFEKESLMEPKYKTQDDFDWMSVTGCPPTCDNYYKNSVWAYNPKKDEIDMVFAEDLKKFKGKYSLWRPCIIVKPPKPERIVNAVKEAQYEK